MSNFLAGPGPEKSWKFVNLSENVKKKQSQNKLTQVEEILAKSKKDCVKNNLISLYIWSLVNLQF